MHSPSSRPTRCAHFVRRYPILIILAWFALTAALNVFVPQLEAVGKDNSVSLASAASQSYKALKRQGSLFHQFNSDSIAMPPMSNMSKTSGAIASPQAARKAPT
ncbi:hypothetical protein NJB14197_27020 [Mycobacterium montefiorense]|uniref:Uncharacterized protein n=1 Tax=Mycobacterium montefiorense TaxID=154654 RepID=A0AA37UYU4_9MYCO|nr:hypothetical protein MmonteBS_22430 [Mycobacterium montefiorense]GKU35009.1 hypothetical protein NJB14191_23550 [Mycobacterium montefiorense]GKU41020.1 hypothetical protein NJB14192_30060 [Mycobacterium montefiorense]GKU47131.1 hypothetical protein NJB14194_37490 [Mycobacterium montefiorense]GKU49251.1 hypothetical protein NJB14195_04980 [Mycobacterium montefiorense]